MVDHLLKMDFFFFFSAGDVGEDGAAAEDRLEVCPGSTPEAFASSCVSPASFSPVMTSPRIARIWSSPRPTHACNDAGAAQEQHSQGREAKDVRGLGKCGKAGRGAGRG